MEAVTNVIGLKVNVDKTKYMNTSKHKHMQPKTENIYYEEYQEVSEFKYLGSLVTYDSDCGKGVSARITAGNQFYHALSKFMKPRYVHIITHETKNIYYNN
jgi:hypothetical protein